MAKVVTNGYPIFTDADGQPLEEGYVFIGVEGQNPLSSPQQAYWDEALTIPATDIRTSGGYPQYMGSPGRLYTANSFSLLVQDRNNATVYYQPSSVDLNASASAAEIPDIAGGLPLGAVLPKTGVTFSGFLDLGTTGLDDDDYPDLAASGLDIINDNGNGTFNLLDSGGSTGWVAHSAWENAEITVAHGLLKDLTDLNVEVYVSASASDSNAFRVLDTSFDAATGADSFVGATLIGVGNASFLLRTGTNGLAAVNSDGTRLVLTTQNWFYKVNYQRKDMPYPGQVCYVSGDFSVDGGDAPAQIISLRFRRDTSGDWTSANPTLALGEAGYATDTGEFKIGDGVTPWNSLSVINTGVSANLGGVIGTDRTFLENDGGVVKVSLGSLIEADGTLYTVTGSAATPTGTPSASAYLFFDPNSGSYTWSTTPGTPDASKGGLYDGSNRRQCRWRLSSTTTWDRVVSDNEDAIFDKDLGVDGDLDVVGDVSATSVSATSVSATSVSATGQITSDDRFNVDGLVFSRTFSSGTISLGSDGDTYVLPAGCYYLHEGIINFNFRVEAFISGGWRLVGGNGFFVSDGSNVRIVSSQPDPGTVYYLRMT